MSALLLSGKRCLVTGASSGIGLATAKVFAKHGATVCATGRNETPLKALQKEFNIHYVLGDLTSKDAPRRIVEEAVGKLGGPLTTLVNSAGVLRGGAWGTPSCDISNYDYNFNHNTRTVFEMMVHAIPSLKAAGPGSCPSIVNVSSINGLVSFATVPSYCASKAAVDMFTKTAAVDLAPFGIRVNSVNPGVVVTELQRRGGVGEEAYGEFLKRSVEVTHPLGKALGRVATAEEVAELIAFLSSDKAAYITGDCIKIDGGRGCVGLR